MFLGANYGLEIRLVVFLLLVFGAVVLLVLVQRRFVVVVVVFRLGMVGGLVLGGLLLLVF